MKKLTIWRFDYMATDDRAEKPYPDSFIGTIYEFSNWISNMAGYYGYWWTTKPKKKTRNRKGNQRNILKLINIRHTI